MEEKRIRTPDGDLIAYLENNEDIFTVDDIANIHAEVPGHNDEDSWYWVIELKDGRFLLTQAWCDYTGWDCQSGGTSITADTAMDAAYHAKMVDGNGRYIFKNLVGQIEGSQPFGLEIRN